MTVNQQESFITYFSKTNDNLFHSQTIGVIWQATLWKMVTHVILSQFWYSLLLQVLKFRFLLTCKIRHGHNSFYKYTHWGSFSFKHLKSLTESLEINDLYWSSWYKRFLGVLWEMQTGEVALFFSGYLLITFLGSNIVAIGFIFHIHTYIWRGSGLTIFSINEFYPPFLLAFLFWK